MIMAKAPKERREAVRTDNVLEMRSFTAAVIRRGGFLCRPKYHACLTRSASACSSPVMAHDAGAKVTGQHQVDAHGEGYSITIDYDANVPPLGFHEALKQLLAEAGGRG